MSAEQMLRRRRPVLVWGILSLLVCYVLLLVGLFTWQRDLLYHPFGRSAAPQSVGVPEMRVQPVHTADGLTIQGWYAPPTRPGAPTVVFYQGNTGTTAMRAFKARVFLDAGLGVWLAGYRGYDGNPGWPTEDGLYADARAPLAWLAAHGTPSQQVVLYGESLGTGVAVQMAAEHQVAAVVLESPYTSVPDIAARRYPLVPVDWLVLDRFDSIDKIGQVSAPLLITHGEQDTVIPVIFAKRLFDRAAGPKEAVYLPRAGHLDLYSWGVGKVILGFIRRWADTTAALAAE